MPFGHPFCFLFVITLGTVYAECVNATQMDPPDALENIMHGIIGCMSEEEDEYSQTVSVLKRNASGHQVKEMNQVYDESNLHLLETETGFPLKNRSCIVSNQSQLQCSGLLDDSNAYVFLSVLQDGKNTTVTCLNSGNGMSVRCQAPIEHSNTDMLNVCIIVSHHNTVYTLKQTYDIMEIEKLNPPQNIRISVVSGDLQIKWDKPTNVRDDCFQYQLKINNINVSVVTKREHFERGIDLTKKHSVQMRVTKTKMCRVNHIWSDWSRLIVLDASQKPYEVNPLVIAAIVFCVPMLLLSVLLFLSRYRIDEWLFPHVPAPSTKIKHLLEKDDLIEVRKKICGEEANDPEAITVIKFSEVKGPEGQV